MFFHARPNKQHFAPPELPEILGTSSLYTSGPYGTAKQETCYLLESGH